MNLLGIYWSLGIIAVFTICYLFKRLVAQRHQAEVVLSQQTKRERVVNQIIQDIRQSLNLEKVLVTTVSQVREFLDCDRVLIYRIWEDGTGSAITENVLEQYPSILGETFAEEVFPKEYHQAYIGGKVRAIADIDREEVESCLAEFVKQFQVKAKLVVPIIQELRSQEDRCDIAGDAANSSRETPSSPYLWGLLIAHQCRKPRNWQALEIDLVTQLATQVAIAIRQSELYEQLQKLNTQLEQRVQQRTEELALTNDSLRAEIVERQRTEAALLHTNQTLQSLISASPRAIFTLNLKNRIEIWNPAAERMFGWSAGEMLEHANPAAFLGSMEGYQQIEQSVLLGITPPSLEVRWKKKDGSAIDIVFSAAPLRDRDGEISGLVAVVADITEQKRQAEQVRLLQSVVVNTNDAIIITETNPIDEPGARILYVNEAFTRLAGYNLEEVLGKSARILHGAKTDTEELNKIRSALVRRQSIIVEVINYRKDGSEFWSEFSVVPVADKNGCYTHWISVQRDITERKHTEAALRRSEERFRSLIENALDIITILGADGVIHYGSPSVERVLGYHPSELIGRNFFEYIHPEDLANCLNITNVIQAPELTRPIEFRCRHQDGSWCSLEAIGQKFIDDNFEPRIVINSRDITERKRLDEVRLALEKEKELSVLKTRFFSMASHEFRTPLSTVLAAAQLLEKSPLENTEKRLRNLRRIQESVKNMVQLLDDILTINRAETGKLEFNPKPIALEKFCRQFVEEMQMSAGNQHTLTFVCQGESTDACLDEKLLRSILANFLSNAIKYSPKGGQIHCSLKFEGDFVSLQIRDRGMGISPEDQKQLFEPFYRGKNVRHIAGTGLGLVVVKKCVDLHGGTIEIMSNLGQGTTATIALPLMAKINSSH